MPVQETLVGLTRLRNASALRFALAVVLIPLQTLRIVQPQGEWGGVAPERIGELFALLGVVLIAGLVAVALLIASWLLRVLGWGNLCRAKVRRFYCVTRIVVLAAPIAGVAVIIFGAVIAVLEALATGLEYAPSARLPQGALGMVLAGLVLVLAADVFEAVATLDLGQIYGVKILSIASLLLLTNTALSAVTNFVQLPAWIPPLVALPTFAMLTAGFHSARKTAVGSLPSREQQEQQGAKL